MSIFPVAEALSTSYLTSRMSFQAREALKDKYRNAKKFGIRSAWAVVSGVGIIELTSEMVRGQVVHYGKKKIGTLLLLTCTHFGVASIPLITNSTKVIKYAKKIHSVSGSIYRCAHDITEVPLIALDFLVFGEYVPSCPADGYQLFNVASDVLDSVID
jgi:hypothetical protein